MVIDEDDKSSDAMFFRKVRRAIARLRTEQRRREFEQGLTKDSLRNSHRNTLPTKERQKIYRVWNLF